MKKAIVTLIAGLFATAAFAQTPAAPAVHASAAASVPAKVEAAHTKAVVKADAKEAQAVVKADAKEAKAVVAAKTDVASAKAEATTTKAKAHHTAKKPRPRQMPNWRRPPLKRRLRQASNPVHQHPIFIRTITL